MKSKILAFAGSTGEDSYNKKLARLSLKYANSIDVKINFIDLRDFTLPLYDGDFERDNPYPKNAKKLKEMMVEHDGILIASPEYNGSLTGVLKNTIDWVSRSEDVGTDLSAFTGKIAAIVSTAPGKLGGLRALVHLRMILSGLGTMILPNQLAVPFCTKAFDESGNIIDEVIRKQYQDIVTTLADTCKRNKIDLHRFKDTLYNEFAFSDKDDKKN